MGFTTQSIYVNAGTTEHISQCESPEAFARSVPLSIILIEFLFSTIRQLHINTNDLIHFLFHALSPLISEGREGKWEISRVQMCCINLK